MQILVASIKGIGQKKAALLAKLNINTVVDLLYYLPRDYQSAGISASISELQEGGVYTVSAVIAAQPGVRRIRKGLSMVSLSLEDDTGRAEAVFFNQPYMRNMYHLGERVYVTGAVRRIGNRLSFTNPSIERQPPASDGLMPIYALTAGLSQKSMRLMIKAALDAAGDCVKEIFPDAFREDNKLIGVREALWNVHFPKTDKALEEAKKRLVFEELLLLCIALERRNTAADGAPVIVCEEQDNKRFFERLGFTPTAAQRRVMNEIALDLHQSKPMNRLVQGDVGSGKTAAAFYAMHMCVQSGYQCVMMVPTEVLAAQHFAAAQRLFCDINVNLELLTGSTPQPQRRLICQNIAGGQTDIVIGTHALLYDHVQFARLGLVVTDEQHRFGVSQRALLESKSIAPHTLIMSATPIPRTLALILYGETNLSVIDEMPPGRTPVKTFCVPEHKREAMYGFLRQEIEQGAQAFVVCPLVEEGEDNAMRSSQQVFDELNGLFFDRGVALLHGRLSSKEKNEVMARFKQKQVRVLVCTTVIEVGVDVPDATVMVIENAERFGLAQLHQLRGRVGRGQKKSYCFLMSQSSQNPRLEIMCRTNDGFVIAEQDLRLRGPGQFLGGRQSGGCDLYMAGLIKDMKMLETAKKTARQLKQHNNGLYLQLSFFADEKFAQRFDQTTIN